MRSFPYPRAKETVWQYCAPRLLWGRQGEHEMKIDRALTQMRRDVVSERREQSERGRERGRRRAAGKGHRVIAPSRKDGRTEGRRHPSKFNKRASVRRQNRSSNIPREKNKFVYRAFRVLGLSDYVTHCFLLLFCKFPIPLQQSQCISDYVSDNIL